MIYLLKDIDDTFTQYYAASITGIHDLIRAHCKTWDANARFITVDTGKKIITFQERANGTENWENNCMEYISVSRVLPSGIERSSRNRVPNENE